MRSKQLSASIEKTKNMPTKDTVEKIEKKAAVKTVAKKAPVKRVVKAPAKSAPKAEVVSKLRIRVQAYEYKILDLSVKQIIDTALRYDAKVLGPIPLPTINKKYTVNRSSFVFKNAREQFEMRVHKRLIDVFEPTPKTIDALMNLSLPAGCDVEIKM